MIRSDCGITFAVGALLTCVLLPSPALAVQSDSELREELQALKRGQEAIQRNMELMREVQALKLGQEELRKELADIKRLLQAGRANAPVPRPAPARAAGPNVEGVVFDLGTNPIKGENNGSSDYRRVHRLSVTVLPQVTSVRRTRKSRPNISRQGEFAT